MDTHQGPLKPVVEELVCATMRALVGPSWHTSWSSAFFQNGMHLHTQYRPRLAITQEERPGIALACPKALLPTLVPGGASKPSACWFLSGVSWLPGYDDLRGGSPGRPLNGIWNEVAGMKEQPQQRP